MAPQDFSGPAPQDFSGPAPLTDKEQVTIFLAILPTTYYDHLIDQADAFFTNVFQKEERIGDVLKTGKLKKLSSTFRAGLE